MYTNDGALKRPPHPPARFWCAVDPASASGLIEAAKAEKQSG